MVTFPRLAQIKQAIAELYIYKYGLNSGIQENFNFTY